MKKPRPNHPCPHCGTKLRKNISRFNLKKLSMPYFYTASIMCDGCKRIYLSDDYKITRAEVIAALK